MKSEYNKRFRRRCNQTIQGFRNFQTEKEMLDDPEPIDDEYTVDFLSKMPDGEPHFPLSSEITNDWDVCDWKFDARYWNDKEKEKQYKRK